MNNSSDVRRWFGLMVKNATAHYSGHSVRTDRAGNEDVEFHKVGHNASHEFWLGILADGRIAVRTVGEGAPDANGDPTVEIGVSVRGWGEIPSYYGHW